MQIHSTFRRQSNKLCPILRRWNCRPHTSSITSLYVNCNFLNQKFTCPIVSSLLHHSRTNPPHQRTRTGSPCTKGLHTNRGKLEISRKGRIFSNLSRLSRSLVWSWTAFYNGLYKQLPEPSYCSQDGVPDSNNTDSWAEYNCYCRERLKEVSVKLSQKLRAKQKGLQLLQSIFFSLPTCFPYQPTLGRLWARAWFLSSFKKRFAHVGAERQTNIHTNTHTHAW